MIVKDIETGEIYKSFLPYLFPYEIQATDEEAEEFERWLAAHDDQESA